MNTRPNKAFFLDRDGTIIEEKGYICHLTQAEIFPYSFEAVRRMNQRGYKVIGVTNQSSIARGICTREQVEALHHQLTEAFRAEGAIIHRFYYCPYHTEGKVEPYRKSSDWRKPEPGMLIQAAEDFDLDLSQSFMVGDNVTDIEAGRNAGCKTVLVLTGKGLEHRQILEERNIPVDYIYRDILTAVDALTAETE